MEKSADAFRTISEVADDLSLPQHVLRFWETRFPQIRPLKRAGGRRYYRPVDVAMLRTIRQLLYDQGYTIKGVQRLLKEQGAKGVRDSVQIAPLQNDADANAMAHDPNTGEDPDEDPSYPNPDGLDRLALDPSLDLEDLRQALSTIEECERILRALHL